MAKQFLAIPTYKENGGVLEDPAIPARAYYSRTKAVRAATTSERPSVGPIARVATSLRASLNGTPASTRVD